MRRKLLCTCVSDLVFYAGHLSVPILLLNFIDFLTNSLITVNLLNVLSEDIIDNSTSLIKFNEKVSEKTVKFELMFTF